MTARKRRNGKRKTERERQRRLETPISKEEFDRATTAMRECQRGLNRVDKRVLARFRKLSPDCYAFYVLWQGDPDFRAYFFVQGRGAVERFNASKHYAELQDLVYQELEAVGHKSRANITVEFCIQDRALFLAK